MKVVSVLHVTGLSGSYNKDLAAMRAGAQPDGFIYRGAPVTPGYERIVQPGAAVSIMLVLDDGQMAFGDCMDVIFSGAAGRDRLFRPAEHAAFLDGALPRLLVGWAPGAFREMAERIDREPIHTALRYGISQALLHACALARRVPMAAVIAAEYGCAPATEPLPMLVSSPTDNWTELDMRILKRADLLPHSAFTHVERHVGLEGEKLVAYARRVSSRIAEIGDAGYAPTIHLDVYGTLGELFGGDIEALAAYLGALREAVDGRPLMVEAPIIMPGRQAQIEAYRALCDACERLGHGTQVIVDEWCNTLQDVRDFADAGAGHLLQVKTPDLGGVTNTIEAVLYARAKGLGVSLGGSLNETDQSARVTAHIGLACRPSYLFAKPGAGGDAGLMIQVNEMRRTLALMARGSR